MDEEEKEVQKRRHEAKQKRKKFQNIQFKEDSSY